MLCMAGFNAATEILRFQLLLLQHSFSRALAASAPLQGTAAPRSPSLLEKKSRIILAHI